MAAYKRLTLLLVPLMSRGRYKSCSHAVAVIVGDVSALGLIVRRIYDAVHWSSFYCSVRNDENLASRIQRQTPSVPQSHVLMDVSS